MSTSTVKILGVDVELCEGLGKDELEKFPAFQNWLPRLQTSLALQDSNEHHPHHNEPYTLHKITTNSYTRFGPKLGFVTLTTDLRNTANESLPGTVFLRGPSVAVLLVVVPKDIVKVKGKDEEVISPNEKYVILTAQARVAAGSLEFLELPAGMVDDNKNFAGAAAKEIYEETKIVIKEEELVDLTALAALDTDVRIDGDGEKKGAGEGLAKGMWPSAGGCDEFITLYYCEKVVAREELVDFQGRLTGLRDEGEKITLKLIKFEDLWREGARDAKALGALALYQNLKLNGKL